MTTSSALPAMTSQKRRVFRYVPSQWAVVVLGLLVLISIVTPWLPISDPVQVEVGRALEAPSMDHIMGTDQFGRDVASRVLWGARSILPLAIIGVAISLALGLPAGLLGGYLGGRLGSITMRGIDIMLAFPALLLALLIVAILGPGQITVAIAVGVGYIPYFARLVFGVSRSLKQRDFITAQKILGSTNLRIVIRHLLPNMATTLVVLISSALGWAIIAAATLNFLGFGVSPPTPDWGADLKAGQRALRDGWWIAAFPGLAITLTILAVNRAGDLLTERIRQLLGGKSANLNEDVQREKNRSRA